ncbi:MAG: CDP-diacylglycerol--glycerol-3-phosphate 3-phosphatidyltransferase [Alphaproteobacteria bacterium]|nr:CDP-diacylglycerol--glycerol-3-phosphate 3-phosphatidyltransferase [Alphaproteobacteria bacterium]MCD8526366.1 CDP-diacylglycerol--glycerol-3-phosphate 3-phosphatidyltransferase [Alphaproteobacteria bacterium]MCD8570219.1 CDP-diacylglycerol--glycerol-3-phosphate 3-phosphatidyltransferase [Alphaproteobacteria bacterium]
MQNIPNALTVLRILLIVPMTALFFFETTAGGWVIWLNFGLYVIAAITDFLDGWLARKYKITSPFGTFLDPISDKILVGCLLVLLVAFGRLEGLWLIAVLAIMTREFLISGLREYLGPHNVKMPVTKLAKWKTATQMLALGLLIIGPVLPYTLLAGQILLCVAALITAITGWGYLKAGLAHMRA